MHKLSYCSKIFSSLEILDPAGAYILSSHIQNISLPAGIGHLNVFLQMVTTVIKWTSGVLAVCFMKLQGRLLIRRKMAKLKRINSSEV